MHLSLRKRNKQSGMRVLGISLFVTALLCCISGCTVLNPQTWTRPKDYLYDKELSSTYDRTIIKKSFTLDVLPRMQKSETELLSLSDSVAASLGSDEDGYKTWFTLIAFHEYELSVVRKYFFVVDEQVEKRFTQDRGLRLDCQMLFTQNELDEISASKEAKELALLRRVFANLESDAAKLGGDAETPGQNNKMLDISVLLIKQVFDTVLRDLDRSPVLAARISDPNGVDFDHLNFGRGKIRVQAEGNTAVVKIRLGALLSTFYELEQTAVVESAAQPARPD